MILDRFKDNFIDSTQVRLAHGYVVERFRPASLIRLVLNGLRCGLVLGTYIFFRLESLQKFRRLRKMDMYRRRNRESREPVFILGTLLRWVRSPCEQEKNISILFMDKWFNRFELGVRVSAQNFLGLGHWDIRSFSRPSQVFLGRKNSHSNWLEKSLKKRPSRLLQ